MVFINGHNLGRYWDLGPQETLYIPSPWFVFFGGFVSTVLFLIADHDVALRSFFVLFCRKGTYVPSIFEINIRQISEY